MALLPAKLSSKTTLQRQPSTRTSVADDGTLRVLDFSTVVWSRIFCVVESLDEGERDSLMLFLDANTSDEIDVVIGGTTYRGRLLPDAAGTWQRTAGLFEIRFTLWARAL